MIFFYIFPICGFFYSVTFELYFLCSTTIVSHLFHGDRFARTGEYLYSIKPYVVFVAPCSSDAEDDFATLWQLWDRKFLPKVKNNLNTKSF